MQDIFSHIFNALQGAALTDVQRWASL